MTSFEDWVDLILHSRWKESARIVDFRLKGKQRAWEVRTFHLPTATLSGYMTLRSG